MADDPEEPRVGRGALAAALGREDLDPYAVSDLKERIAVLEAEIARARAAMTRKGADRAAADALFGAAQ